MPSASKKVRKFDEFERSGTTRQKKFSTEIDDPPGMITSSAIFAISGDTNWWDALAIVAAASALLVGSAGGIVALTQKPECHVERAANADTCCGQYAPPRLLPLVAIFMSVLMETFVVVKRLFIAPKMHRFAAEAREIARDDVALSRNVGTGDQAHEDKTDSMAGWETMGLERRLETTGMDGTPAPLKAGDKLDNIVTNAMDPGKVSKSARGLLVLSALQCMFALGFIATPCSLISPLGPAVAVGPSKHIGEYYNFQCPEKCSQLSNATDPDQKTIECFISTESPALFWMLLIAALAFGIASWGFFVFAQSLTVKLPEHVDDTHKTALILAKYTSGDNRDVVFESFVLKYQEERSLEIATRRKEIIRDSLGKWKEACDKVRKAIGKRKVCDVFDYREPNRGSVWDWRAVADEGDKPTYTKQLRNITESQIATFQSLKYFLDDWPRFEAMLRHLTSCSQDANTDVDDWRDRIFFVEPLATALLKRVLYIRKKLESILKVEENEPLKVGTCDLAETSKLLNIGQLRGDERPDEMANDVDLENLLRVLRHIQDNNVTLASLMTYGQAAHDEMMKRLQDFSDELENASDSDFFCDLE